jgi:RNA polymerase sigma-70 factor (ECF subfamily)
MHHTDVEQQLVKRVLNGDAKAEAMLYRQYAVAMFRVCLRYARDTSEAEDMLQEGFLQVFTDLAQYRFEGSLEGWIRRVIVRSALRNLRRWHVFESLEQAPESLLIHHDEPDEIPPLPQQFGQVVYLMQRLPDGYRTILNLYAVEGYSHDEISVMLGISTGTSRSQLHKARAMLRRMLTAAETTGL